MCLLGDHIIIDNHCVKLCNLTTAVVCNGLPYDEDMLEDVMMTLPPHVLPPEVGELYYFQLDINNK